MLDISTKAIISIPAPPICFLGLRTMTKEEQKEKEMTRKEKRKFLPN